MKAIAKVSGSYLSAPKRKELGLLYHELTSRN